MRGGEGAPDGAVSGGCGPLVPMRHVQDAINHVLVVVARVGARVVVHLGVLGVRLVRQHALLALGKATANSDQSRHQRRHRNQKTLVCKSGYYRNRSSRNLRTDTGRSSSAKQFKGRFGQSEGRVMVGGPNMYE